MPDCPGSLSATTVNVVVGVMEAAVAHRIGTVVEVLDYTKPDGMVGLGLSPRNCKSGTVYAGLI